MPEGRRQPHPHCPNCGLEFDKPLPWSARCPACGRLLFVSRKAVAIDAPRFSLPDPLRRVVRSCVRIGGVLGIAALTFLLLRGGAPSPQPAAQATVAAKSAGQRSLPKISPAAQAERQRQIAQCNDNDMATTTAHGTQASYPVGYSSLRFFYNPALAPEGANEAQMAAMIASAGAAWSACGIRGEYAGPTNELDARDNATVMQWFNSDGVPIAGYSKGSTIYLNIAVFQRWYDVSPKYAMEALQQVIAHEMGHSYGVVEHSARCIDVMATYDAFDKCEQSPVAPRLIEDGNRVFQLRAHTLPTACDIQRCRKVNSAVALLQRSRP
jgi:hypothetical protein